MAILKSQKKGNKKKKEFTENVLTNDLFPHCKTKKQKIYFLGYMANQLIRTALGWIPTDDRDSYLNKRIELTGTLLNNLFRNYFNKVVKDIQRLLLLNMRLPDERKGDLNAQISACRLGVKRIQELLSKHGASYLNSAFEEIFDLVLTIAVGWITFYK